jgi:large subunit ribosomal protein L22
MARSGTDLAAVRVTRKGATIHKTNERPGTRAEVRYVRVSAYKAREVLDLIRDKHVTDADEILGLVERDVAQIIRKCLASAVANAVNNDDQDAEALYVSACFADEGPTLKRWRPRARGRATRIRKRTCHITIIVSRLADDVLRRRTEKAAAGTRPTGAGRRSTAGGAAARRARVARSRQAETHEHDHDHDHDHDHEEPAEADAPEAEVIEAEGTEAEAAEAKPVKAAKKATKAAKAPKAETETPAADDAAADDDGEPEATADDDEKDAD